MSKSSAYLRCFQVQLYDGTPSQFVSQREASQIIDRGDGKRLRRKAHQGWEIIRLFKPIEPSDSKASACSLTVSDMRINAGEIGCGVFYLELLSEKIEHFKPMSLRITVVDGSAIGNLFGTFQWAYPGSMAVN